VHLLGQPVTDREAQPLLAAEVQQVVRRTSAAGASEDLDQLDQLSRDLRERVLDDRDDQQRCSSRVARRSRPASAPPVSSQEASSG
jgi:hypothetical protein